jgi:hypothetical protein
MAGGLRRIQQMAGGQGMCQHSWIVFVSTLIDNRVALLLLLILSAAGDAVESMLLVCLDGIFRGSVVAEIRIEGTLA